MLSGDNGLLKRAGDARDDTVVGQEKEQVELAYVSAAVKNLGENVTGQNLQDELDNLVGNEKTDVSTNDDNTLNVIFIDTGNKYNVNSGKVSKIEQLELHISNYTELLDFANRVNSDGETFENYIVYLDNDIEIEDEDWVQIGTPGDRVNPPNEFRGTFEGNNHTIENLKFLSFKKNNGLFCYNGGIIQNLNVTAEFSGNIGQCVGSIAGINIGKIKNCKSHIECGNTISGSTIGGISGSNSGIIENCILYGELTTGFSSSTIIGGIAGSNSYRNYF